MNLGIKLLSFTVSYSYQIASKGTFNGYNQMYVCMYFIKILLVKEHYFKMRNEWRKKVHVNKCYRMHVYDLPIAEPDNNKKGRFLGSVST